MSKTRLNRGLYLITPDDADGDRLVARTLPLLRYASCLQLRAKGMGAAALATVGARLRTACSEARIPLIVNDDAALAHALGADGVHLGERDGGIAEARALLGDHAIVGVSCYDDLGRARRLAAQGADYVAFGAFYPSPTKPGARRASLSLLRDSAALGLPRVAIGGITPDNARPLVDAGADLVAVISGVFDAPDPPGAARACLTRFQGHAPA